MQPSKGHSPSPTGDHGGLGEWGDTMTERKQPSYECSRTTYKLEPQTPARRGKGQSGHRNKVTHVVKFLKKILLNT